MAQPDLLEKSKNAKRESKYVDFKERFDPSSDAEWCELVKDLVAMANSGGGVVVVGVMNDGSPSGVSVKDVLDLDPAVITDKVFKYTGDHFSEFEVHDLKRRSRRVAVIQVRPVAALLVFNRPGTYAVSSTKQKTAFSQGTVYFRHGAKSEPGTAVDLERFIDRRIEIVRKSWIGGIRKIVSAPPGSEIAVLRRASGESQGAPTSIRVTDDPGAPIYGKLDPDVSHPYRQTDVIPVINSRLSGKTTINRHDIKCIRSVFSLDADSKPEFFHKPKFGSIQYSEAFIDYLVEQHRRDSKFFSKARERHYARTHTT